MKNRDLRIAETTREKLQLSSPLFSTDKGARSYYNEASSLSYKYNTEVADKIDGNRLSAGKLNAVAILHLVYQYTLSYLLGEEGRDDLFARRIPTIESNSELKEALTLFDKEFPSLLENKEEGRERIIEAMRGFFIHQVLLENPAIIAAAKPLIEPKKLPFSKQIMALSSVLSSYQKEDLRNGQPNEDDIFTLLTLPGRLFPDSLEEQIRYIIRSWAHMLPSEFTDILKLSLDFIREETKDRGFGGGKPGPMKVIDYAEEANEYEAFSSDSNWMPKVVMMAKSTLVWLDQLSKKYKRRIETLDAIPDEELDLLKERGFTALWLIGLWERSKASATIKHLCGNPDAVASAYSLKDYDISSKIGGWSALSNLRERCMKRGIRLASDMVPNHTGLDSAWVYEHPELFISQDYPPFPSYTYNGPDLSDNPDWEIKLEDHYYNRTDAAVTFSLKNKRSGQVRYVFHGNDGTTMPWNDTAQLDYLNPDTREAVIQKIIHVANNFPIIRFDAAMTLAKRHIERLWYPKPGEGGDIAGRTPHSLSAAEFNRRIPVEFWREVVDRIAAEAPDTLLLAEAFWMMEGYFVRTLGMHRVYNSAFMNMLKNQENKKYRDGIKNTLVFEPEILKRYVNFMNNPDEDTAIAQFGDGDRYFAVATLLATLPGLPMIGHGQIEGFTEKYGMEYQRAYFDEEPNEHLINEHYRRIFPLFRKRYLFSGVSEFNLFDAKNNDETLESVFAYTNGANGERALILINNQYERVSGTIKRSAPKSVKQGEDKALQTVSIAEALGLHFSPKCYALLDSFSDGLTYIIPSIKLFEDGLPFSLNGYEAKICLNIREVEDSDGNYEKLYREYGERGIKDIRAAINLLRLKPVYEILSKLKSAETIKYMKALVKGTATNKEIRVLLYSVAECYTTLYASYPSFDETLKSIIGEVLDTEPSPIVSAVNVAQNLFSNSEIRIFSCWESLDPTLYLLLTEALFLIPFKTDETIRGTLVLADKLYTSHFFIGEGDKLALDTDKARTLAHEAALLLAFYRIFKSMKEKDSNEEKERTPLEYISALLNDSAVMSLINVNEYQGELWYNKEMMQKVILISTLALSLVDPKSNANEYSAALLKKELESGYKLKAFLSPKKK